MCFSKKKISPIVHDPNTSRYRVSLTVIHLKYTSNGEQTDASCSEHTREPMPSIPAPMIGSGIQNNCEWLNWIHPVLVVLSNADLTCRGDELPGKIVRHNHIWFNIRLVLIIMLTFKNRKAKNKRLF